MKLEKAFKSSKTPVIVAHDSEGFDNIEVLSFVCESTGTKVILNNSLAPMSPFSGGDLIPATDVTASLSEDEIKELVQIATCPDCGSIHRTEASLASKIDGEHMNCITCGSDMTIEVSMIGSAEDEDEEEEEKEADMDDEDKDEDNVHGDIDGEMDTVTDEDMEEEEKSDEEDKKADGKNKKVDDKDEKLADNTSKEEGTTTAYVIDSFKSLSSDDFSIENINLANSGSSDNIWYMFVKHTPVATLSKKKANTETAKLFDKEKSLRDSLFAAISVSGLNDTVVKDFGIESIALKIDIATVVQDAIDTKTSEVVSQYEVKEKEVFDTLKQCASIAAVGIAKNTFKDVNNTLRTSLISEFKKLGVSNANLVVDSVIKKEIENFAKTILAKAYELKDKTVDSRNELAKMVENANFNYMELVETSNTTHKATVLDQTIEESSVTNTNKYASIFNYSKKR